MTRACQISSRAAFPPACPKGAGIPTRVPARCHLADPGALVALRSRAQEEGRMSPLVGSSSNAWNVNFNNGNTNNNDVSNTNNVRCVR